MYTNSRVLKRMCEQQYADCDPAVPTDEEDEEEEAADDKHHRPHPHPRLIPALILNPVLTLTLMQ